jgi:hypothetical protein
VGIGEPADVGDRGTECAPHAPGGILAPGLKTWHAEMFERLGIFAEPKVDALVVRLRAL